MTTTEEKGEEEEEEKCNNVQAECVCNEKKVKLKQFGDDRRKEKSVCVSECACVHWQERFRSKLNTTPAQHSAALLPLSGAVHC